MKLLTILFCFLSMSKGRTEPRYGQQNDVPSKNYLNYYRSVALAEEAVVNGNYRDAIKRYQIVFEEYPFNNPIDCYVAAQVASYTGDTASCFSFMYRGVCFGLPVETIINNPHLTEFLKKTNQQSIDSCRDIYEKGIDNIAREKIISLAKHDQEFIHHLPPMGIYENDGRTLKEIYRPFYDSLIAEIINLTLTHGFPAQKVVGTHSREDSLFRVGPNSVYALYMFIHHGNAWNRIGKLLRAELSKGNITPQMYGVIYEAGNRNSEYPSLIRYFASSPCYKWRCKKFLRKKHLKEINRHRWEIGLGSYEVMQKKVKSGIHYYKWRKKDTRESEPFFDFEWKLGFQGNYSHQSPG